MTTTNRPPLSDTQAKVLAYLVKFLELNDQLPTIAKIAEDFGWASSNSADTHLKAMEKKGYLARNELHNLMLADRPARPAGACNWTYWSAKQEVTTGCGRSWGVGALWLDFDADPRGGRVKHCLQCGGPVQLAVKEAAHG